MVINEKVDKQVNKEYCDIIGVCKLLKFHATNALLLDGGLVALQPIIDGIRNYMILDRDMVHPRFRGLFLNLGEVASVNSKFKKTMSYIEWGASNGIAHIDVCNDGMDPYRVHMLTDQQMIEDTLNQIYARVPFWDDTGMETLSDEEDGLYTWIDDLATDLYEKKMCRIVWNEYQFLFSKPFLGDTKKTEAIGYRVVSCDPGDKGKLTVKFKQKEQFGNIYTYASFLKIPEALK